MNGMIFLGKIFLIIWVCIAFVFGIISIIQFITNGFLLALFALIKAGMVLFMIACIFLAIADLLKKKEV